MIAPDAFATYHAKRGAVLVALYAQHLAGVSSGISAWTVKSSLGWRRGHPPLSRAGLTPLFQQLQVEGLVVIPPRGFTVLESLIDALLDTTRVSVTAKLTDRIECILSETQDYATHVPEMACLTDVYNVAFSPEPATSQTAPPSSTVESLVNGITGNALLNVLTSVGTVAGVPSGVVSGVVAGAGSIALAHWSRRGGS